MYLKLTSVKEGKIANKWPAIIVKGQNLANNEEWEKAFFSNQEDLADAIKNYDVGDEINVVLENKGKNWNIVGFKDMTQDDYNKLEANGKKYGKPAAPAKSAASNTKEAAAPATKSTWNGRTGEAYDRSAAIYLAMDLVKALYDTNDLRQMGGPGVVAELCELAEPIYNYIHDGAMLARPEPERDPLEPPDLE